MALVDRSIGRFGMAAIVAAVLTALAVASPGPARGQDTGDQAGGSAAPEAEAMAPGGYADDDGRRRRRRRHGPAHRPRFSTWTKVSSPPSITRMPSEKPGRLASTTAARS